MLNTLRFVRGAVSTKDLVPVLTSFHLYGDRMQGTNGRITVDAPCSTKITDFTVNANRFLSAVDACEGEPIISITKGDKLSVKKGSFKALIPLVDHSSFPKIGPDKTVKLGTELLSTLRLLRSFIGEDASRPWACGVLIKSDFIYATNNIVLCRTPFSWKHKEAVLPSFAIDELLRINQEPVGVGFSDNSITFKYEDGSWLKSTLFHNEWPDVESMLSKIKVTTKVPEDLESNIRKVIPFCPDPKYPVIKIKGNRISTLEGEMSAEVGKCGPDDLESNFRAEPLLSVVAVATKWDLSVYPKPCPWKSDQIEGVLVGVQA